MPRGALDGDAAGTELGDALSQGWGCAQCGEPVPRGLEQFGGGLDPATDQPAKLFDVPHFSDHTSLLERARPDAVIIANPNDLHVPTALDCLAADVPALVEKPVGVNPQEVDELAAAVDRTGVPVLVGHHRRHHPVISAAKQYIASGELGQIVAINALWLTRKPEDYFATWRSTAGAGVLLINLVHDIDVLRYMCGEITSVVALTSSAARGLAVEDTASLTLQFAGGALGSIIGSDAATAPWGWDKNSGDDPYFAQEPDHPCFMIAGTEGSIQVPQLATWSYRGQADWTAPLTGTQVQKPAGGALDRQLAHFVQVVRGEAQPLVSVRDAGRTITVVDACHRAATTGQRVDLGAAPADVADERERLVVR